MLGASTFQRGAVAVMGATKPRDDIDRSIIPPEYWMEGLLDFEDWGPTARVVAFVRAREPNGILLRRPVVAVRMPITVIPGCVHLAGQFLARRCIKGVVG